MPPRVAAAGLMLAVAVAVVCTAPAAQVDTELHALLQKASNALHSQRWREARSLYKEADARVKTGSGSPAAADGLAQVYQGLQREAAKQGDERQQARYFEKAAEQLRRLVQHYRQLFSSEMRGRRHGPITVLDNDDNEGDGGPSLGEYLGHAEFNYGAHLAAAPALARTAITERDADAHLAAAVAADPGMHNARALLALRRARAGAHDRAWPLLEGIKADEVDSSVGSKLDVLALKGATCARLTAPDYSCAIDAYEALLAEPVPALPVTPRAAEAGVSNDGSIVVDDVTEHAWRRRDHAQQKRMEAHAELVRLQLARGKPRRALRAARAAVEDGFDVWDVREARAVAQWRLGNWDRALEVYKQAYAAISEAHGSLQPGEPLPTWWSDVEQSMGASLSWLRYEQEREARESEDRPTTVDDGSSGHVYRPGGRVDGSGGWSPEFSLSADSSECEIDRRSDLSKHDFLMQYVDANKPVLMTGSLDDEAPRGTPTVTFTEFVNTYMPNDGKRRPGDSGMSQRYDPPYVYEVDPFPGWGTDWLQPPHFDDRRFTRSLEEQRASAVFFAGPRHSGSAFHRPGNSWHALVFGRKRWQLVPPFEFAGPVGLAPAKWEAAVAGKGIVRTVFECVQEPGDILYVPQGWHVGELNLRDSVGMAIRLGPHAALLEAAMRFEGLVRSEDRR